VVVDLGGGVEVGDARLLVVAPDAGEDELVDALLAGDVGDVLALLDLPVVADRPEVGDGEDGVRVADGSTERLRFVEVALDHRDATRFEGLCRVARRVPGEATDREVVVALEQVVDDRAALVTGRSNDEYVRCLTHGENVLTATGADRI
jgi:hypothetical protein